MDRREALRMLALGSLTAGFTVTACDLESRKKFEEKFSPEDQELWEKQFFTDHEFETVRQLVNKIIPADDRSGSAEDAKVPEFIDFMMLDKPELQTPVRGGLKWLDVTCNQLFGNNFADCSSSQQEEMLDKIAYPEMAEPEMRPGVNFFNQMRDLTASGFWTSKMGIEDINYIGNQPTHWDGCSDEALAHLGVSYKDS